MVEGEKIRAALTEALSTEPPTMSTTSIDPVEAFLRSRVPLAASTTTSSIGNRIENVDDKHGNGVTWLLQELNHDTPTTSSPVTSTLLRQCLQCFSLDVESSRNIPKRVIQNNSPQYIFPKLLQIISSADTSNAFQSSQKTSKAIHQYIDIAEIIKGCSPLIYHLAMHLPSNFDSNEAIYSALLFLCAKTPVIQHMNTMSSQVINPSDYFPSYPLLRNEADDNEENNNRSRQNTKVGGLNPSSFRFRTHESFSSSLLQNFSFLSKLANLEQCFWASTAHHPSRLRGIPRMDASYTFTPKVSIERNNESSNDDGEKFVGTGSLDSAKRKVEGADKKSNVKRQKTDLVLCKV